MTAGPLEDDGPDCPGAGKLARSIQPTWRHPVERIGVCDACGRTVALTGVGIVMRHRARVGSSFTAITSTSSTDGTL